MSSGSVPGWYSDQVVHELIHELKRGQWSQVECGSVLASVGAWFHLADPSESGLRDSKVTSPGHTAGRLWNLILTPFLTPLFCEFCIHRF